MAQINPSPTGSVGGASPKRAASPIDLLKVVPLKMKDFNVEAHQWVPGAKDSAVEAMYQLEKEREDIPPFNSYVKVTFFEDPRDANEVVEKNLKLRYPADTAIMMRNGIRVHTGYEEKHGGFYVAAIVDQYLLEIHTNYLNAIPGEKGVILEDCAWKIFDKVSKRLLEESRR